MKTFLFLLCGWLLLGCTDEAYKYKPTIHNYYGTYKDRSDHRGAAGGSYTGKSKPVEKVKTRTITKTVTHRTPWWVFGLVAGLGAAGGWWLRSWCGAWLNRLPAAKWLLG